MLTHPTASDWRAQKYSVQCAYLANALFRDVYSQGNNPSLSQFPLSPRRRAMVFSDIRMFCRRTVESAQWRLPTVASSRHARHDLDRRESRAKKRVGGTRAAGTMSNAQYNNNAILVALLVQRIGDAAEVCQALGLNFRRLLLTVAYPLLEKLGNANPVVSQAAHATLRRVASYCGYGGDAAAATGVDENGTDALSHLLRDNMDYLVDAVCARLSLPEQHPGTAAVIRGIFNRSNSSLTGQDEATTALLTEVVSTLLLALDREFQSPVMHEEGSEGALSGVYTLLEVCREIVVSLRGSVSPDLDWVGLEGALAWSQKSRAKLPKREGGGEGGAGEKVEDAFLNLAKEMQEWQQQVTDLLGGEEAVGVEAGKEAEEVGDDEVELVARRKKEAVVVYGQAVHLDPRLHTRRQFPDLADAFSAAAAEWRRRETPMKL